MGVWFLHCSACFISHFTVEHWLYLIESYCVVPQLLSTLLQFTYVLLAAHRLVVVIWVARIFISGRDQSLSLVSGEHIVILGVLFVFDGTNFCEPELVIKLSLFRCDSNFFDHASSLRHTLRRLHRLIHSIGTHQQRRRRKLIFRIQYRLHCLLHRFEWDASTWLISTRRPFLRSCPLFLLERLILLHDDRAEGIQIVISAQLMLLGESLVLFEFLLPFLLLFCHFLV